MVEDAIGRPDTDRGGCRWVHHNLHQGRGGCTGRLLEAGDGLTECLAASLPVLLLELRDLKPADERARSDPGSLGRLVYVALREKGGNGLFAGFFVRLKSAL